MGRYAIDLRPSVQDAYRMRHGIASAGDGLQIHDAVMVLGKMGGAVRRLQALLAAARYADPEPLQWTISDPLFVAGFLVLNNYDGASLAAKRADRALRGSHDRIRFALRVYENTSGVVLQTPGHPARMHSASLKDSIHRATQTARWDEMRRIDHKRLCRDAHLIFAALHDSTRHLDNVLLESARAARDRTQATDNYKAVPTAARLVRVVDRNSIQKALRPLRRGDQRLDDAHNTFRHSFL